MIKIYEHSNITNIVTQEYICPVCGESLKWRVPGQMSPLSCIGCKTKLIDITKVMVDLNWRWSYHFKGDNTVKCISSVL